MLKIFARIAHCGSCYRYPCTAYGIMRSTIGDVARGLEAQSD